MGKKSATTHNKLLELFRQTPSNVLMRAFSEHWNLGPAPRASNGKRGAKKQQRLNLRRWVAKVRKEYAEDIRPSAEDTDLSPGRPRLRNWQIWQDRDGEQNLHWAAAPYDHPNGRAELVREFESLNWITALRRAFGTRVSIDRGIRGLVTLLNQLPGMMTVSCCQGHDDDESEPYVSLIFDDEAALRRFLALAQFLSDEESPMTMELSITWAQTVVACQQDQPPGALSVCMELMFRSSDELPQVEALDALAVLLRERAERAGLLRQTRRRKSVPKAKRKEPTR